MSKKEKRALTDDQIHELAGDLMGTCGDIDEHLPEGITFDDLTLEDCSLLDDEVMKCDECGWWVESGLINDEGKCDECVEDEDE